MNKGFQKRQEIWRHNGFIGSASMMRAQCFSIIESKTATYEAKKIAQQIRNLTFDLAEALKKRNDK